MNKMEDGTSRHLVIGLGEVGQAVREVFVADGYDPYQNIDDATGKYDFVHICYPHGKDFIAITQAYLEKYLAPSGIPIIHSTVPVGTSWTLGAVHSPIRGVHPDLAQSIKTFVKFIGGERSLEAAKEFEKFGVTCEATTQAANTEALKLWDTTQHGLAILLEKFIHAYCKLRGLDFYIVYTRANKTYNDGYRAMGKPQFCRPALEQVDGPIGGHCVLPNAKLLNHPLGKWLIKTNQRIKN